MQSNITYLKENQFKAKILYGMFSSSELNTELINFARNDEGPYTFKKGIIVPYVKENLNPYIDYDGSIVPVKINRLSKCNDGFNIEFTISSDTVSNIMTKHIIDYMLVPRITNKQYITLSHWDIETFDIFYVDDFIKFFGKGREN